MIIPAEARGFLRGENFSNAFSFSPDSTPSPLRERIDFICEMVKGSTVIHLGCADHMPTIPGKMETDKWFHQRLAKSCSQLAGIDIDKEAVDYLKKQGVPDLFCLDITKDPLPPEISAQHWDYLILGELLEHIGNPAEFMETIKALFSPITDTIIISVPNAFREMNFIQAKNHCELSNSDHRQCYSPYTLAKTLTAAGLTPREISFCMYEIPARSRRLIIQQYLHKQKMRKFPLLRDVIVMTASFA